MYFLDFRSFYESFGSLLNYLTTNGVFNLFLTTVLSYFSTSVIHISSPKIKISTSLSNKVPVPSLIPPSPPSLNTIILFNLLYGVQA